MIKARDSQPPKGNYRIDRDGQPIFKSQPMIDDADYFERSQSVTPKYSRPQSEEKMPSINSNEYLRRQKIWQRRMNQPQQDPLWNQRPGYHAYPRKRSGNYRLDPSPKRESSRIQDNWYYQIQQRFSKSRRQLKAGGPSPLPGNRIQLFAVFSFLMIAYLISGWQIMPMNRLNNITVSGNHYMDSAMIINSSRLHPMDQFKVVMKQKQAIEDKIIEEIPMIENVDFQRESWQNLDLRVSEHAMVAITEVNGRKVPILANGHFLMGAQSNLGVNDLSKILPKLVNFDQKGKVSELTNNALRNLSKELLAKIETITLSKAPDRPNTIFVDMKDGNQVVAIINTFSQKMKYYPQMLEQLNGQVGTINLEVGAYFTPDQSTNYDNLNNN